jgi:hypothetical protein
VVETGRLRKARQFIDALNVAKVQGEKLDRAYLAKWAGELGIRELLERLVQELG